MRQQIWDNTACPLMKPQAPPIFQCPPWRCLLADATALHWLRIPPGLRELTFAQTILHISSPTLLYSAHTPAHSWDTSHECRTSPEPSSRPLWEEAASVSASPACPWFLPVHHRPPKVWFSPSLSLSGPTPKKAFLKSCCSIGRKQKT